MTRLCDIGRSKSVVLLLAHVCFLSGRGSAEEMDMKFSQWPCRDAIRVDNTAGKHALSGYQVRVVLQASHFSLTKAQADGRDLRFVDSDERTPLSYWIESYDWAAKQATLWVKVPEIPASASKTIYLHYGNPTAQAASNGQQTFEFFDDCESGKASERWAAVMGNAAFEYVSYSDVFGKPGGVWHASFAKNRRYPGNNTVYGGGHATYCAWTRPMAIYAPSQDKTFFVFGNAENAPTISFYDHKSKRFGHAVTVAANPDMDAHKNPHLLIDEDGFLYMFYRAHCTPTHAVKSVRPFDISKWESLGVVVESSSYPQPWQLKRGEIIVLYRGGGTHNATQSYVKSTDGGATWSSPVHIATPPPKNGIYGVSIAETGAYPRKVHIAWSLTRGDWWQRYHVFYAHSDDGGTTWRKSDGSACKLPISEPTSEMIFESAVPDRGVWLKDIQLDSKGNPYVLFIDANSLTYESVWRLAKCVGGKWTFHEIATSDHPYDDGALVMLDDGDIRVYAPTTASQPHLDGGKIEEWRSTNGGKTWTNTKHLTTGPRFSHNHVKTVFNGGKGDFRVFWNHGDASYPPATTDVDLFCYGEDLPSPQKMDLSYAPSPLPGRLLVIRQPERVDSAIKVKHLFLANVAIEARARTGPPQRQHPMLCVRMNDSARFYGAGVPYGQGRVYKHAEGWSTLVAGKQSRAGAADQEWSFRAFGNTLQFVVDGELLTEARDADFADGAVGARVHKSTLYLDNIRVRKFCLPEPTATVLSRR
jgi:hypothetical protein